MGNFRNLILRILIIILFVSSVILYHKFTVLESRINTFTPNELQIETNPTTQEGFQKFKEDYYIKQLDRDTTLILVIFPILLGIVATFSYISVKDEFKRQIGLIRKDYEKQISDYHNTANQFVETQGDLNYEVALSRDKESEEHLRAEDWKRFIEYKLLANDYYSLSILQKGSANLKFVESVKEIILANLQAINIVLESKGEIKLDISYDKFIRIKNNIEKIENPEMNKLIATTFSKVSFENLT